MPERKELEMEPEYEILFTEVEQAAEEAGISPQFLIELEAINQMRLMAEELASPICHFSTSS